MKRFLRYFRKKLENRGDGDSSTLQLDAMKEKATHIVGLAAIVYISYRISLPILRGVGKFDSRVKTGSNTTIFTALASPL
jgi:hypothetical protein